MTRIADPGRVRALHVDHGLHRDSARWARHCERLCARLAVPFVGLHVEIDTRDGTGIEAAARRARYAALAEQLADDEILLTAHHADDQLETLLLRLARGTGVRGMRGILPAARLGRMRVARPMLGFTRSEIVTVAGRWGLDWLEDPSNRSLDFDRNLIRARLAPILRERWGDSIAQRASSLAAAMRDAESILEDVARRDLEAAGAEPGRVPLEALRAIGAARQRNVLRRAIRDAGLPMPNARRLEALRRAIGATAADAARRVEWRGAEARVHRDRLYLLASASASASASSSSSASESSSASQSAAASASQSAAASASESASAAASESAPASRAVRSEPAMRVSAGEPWQGPAGRLTLEPVAPPAGSERARRAPRGFGDDGRPENVSRACGLPESWARDGLDVRFRRGGERFKPAGSRHHRTLKAWLREKGVVPWMRDTIPLLYRDERLVAIADLEIDDDACRARPDEPRWRVRWLDHARID